MLEYQWANNNPYMLLSGDEPSAQDHQCDQTYHTNLSAIPNTFSQAPYPFQLQDNKHPYPHPQHTFRDPLHNYSRSYATSLSYTQPHQPFPPPSALTLEPIPSDSSFIFITKDDHTMDYSTRIGLNLGGRTYFSSSSENDFFKQLYRPSRHHGTLNADSAAAANAPRCQAQGCNADLTHAKHYHRRHKVCEFHSKATTALISGLTQRFCQQCSRFHLLSEFDQGKRSCRKRLADHNRRRRKSQPQQQLNQHHQIENTDRPTPAISMSSPDSGAHSSLSVTVAVSPTRITSFGSFRSLTAPDSTASAAASSCMSSFSRW
ncbi:hypothetical protein Syun_012309 [Stephania yunnanensis]|uniref:SBP-type domain-containing protein n=1 Tax=Stephania yunnanensis TaxID=152371 RepID=A0AAP0JZZ4_9MAGN